MINQICPQITHHGEVGVHGVQFEIDLFVDALLRFLVVVLSHLTHGHSFFWVFGRVEMMVNSWSLRVASHRVLKGSRLPVQSLLQLSKTEEKRRDGLFYTMFSAL